MNIIIIEDEIQTALDLKHTIMELRPECKILAILDSVETGVQWIQNNDEPDLIFSDIRLGDGLSFEIFGNVEISCPVIFCTAFDEYALKAFQSNGIDYLLKPIDEGLLLKSIIKFDVWKKPIQSKNINLESLLKELGKSVRNYRTNLLISFREKLLPIHVNDIDVFAIKDDTTLVYIADGRQFSLNHSLDYYEENFNPLQFYRANRQYLISYISISEIEYYIDRRLIIKFKRGKIGPITISKAKATEFIKWMENR
ncbi:MAG: LytTR family DNA-binding domain-containing protein [Ferruginibacter sp.]